MLLCHFWTFENFMQVVGNNHAMAGGGQNGCIFLVVSMSVISCSLAKEERRASQVVLLRLDPKSTAVNGSLCMDFNGLPLFYIDHL